MVGVGTLVPYSIDGTKWVWTIARLLVRQIDVKGVAGLEHERRESCRDLVAFLGEGGEEMRITPRRWDIEPANGNRDLTISRAAVVRYRHRERGQGISCGLPATDSPRLDRVYIGFGGGDEIVIE